MGLFHGPQFKSTVAILYVCFAASLWKCFVLTPKFLPFVRSQFAFWFPFPGELDFFLGTFRIFGAFVLFGIIPVLIVKLVFREKLRNYGLQWGVKRLTLRSFLIMLPIFFVIACFAGKNSAFLEVYPLNRTLEPGVSGRFFLMHALTYVFYYAGWEFLFRGFLIKATEPQMGASNAVLLQTLASTMMHFGHPAGEVFGSILAGLFWGFLVYRTNSLVSGFLQHAFLGISLDYFLLFGTAR